MAAHKIPEMPSELHFRDCFTISWLAKCGSVCFRCLIYARAFLSEPDFTILSEEGYSIAINLLISF